MLTHFCNGFIFFLASPGHCQGLHPYDVPYPQLPGPVPSGLQHDGQGHKAMLGPHAPPAYEGGCSLEQVEVVDKDCESLGGH